MENGIGINSKYKKEIALLKNIFGESCEKAGGKGHRFYHCVRVAHYCDRLARKFGLSKGKKELLILAALFHDIGKAPRIREDGSLDGSREADKKEGSHTDSKLVLSLLKERINYLYDEATLQKITNIIAGHRSKESKILSDSDILDEVGLINVWKMFTYGGARKVDINETLKYYFEEDRPRLIEKIRKLLRFNYSKELAKKRIDKVDSTLTKLEEEAEGRDVE